MRVIRFGLVGCGRIAKRHAELLGNGHIFGGLLAAVCDTDLSKAKQLGDKYKVGYYSDMHAMANNEELDVFVILTESGNHAHNTIELANYGKHIVVEKPMALTLSDADRMIQACEKFHVKLFVVKQNRFNLPIIKLRQAIEQQRFGKLVMGTVRVRWCRTNDYYSQAPWRGTWAMDGGVLANQASHHIDMLLWMMGDVQSVYALGATQLALIEAEDTAVASIRFYNGALGAIEATTATRPFDQEGSISILGENGIAEVGGFAMNQIRTWQFSKQDSDDDDVVSRYSTNPPDVYGYGHKSYYEHVIACLVGGGSNLIDGYSGRRSLELISAIYESIQIENSVSMRFTPSKSRLGF